ncbi:transporter substrate-binding domain-containing protein [Haematospirillum sp. H1815]|uniref:substrate-binding periplasmic protein n=1 Tax=Haematospirillum sp. H1815 TaxID=2723108 RepID=UPI001439CAFE|nr:transporter substrate-binding domain-containing protein [Haematospirillum sp. H1815]NKD78143.1 transporter substrate-binding domain-containing protein [Haematospirillum sp. H1815]
MMETAMLPRATAVFAWLGIALFSLTAHAQSKDIQFGLADNAPLGGVHNGQADGVFGIAGTHILKTMGYNPTALQLPFSRLYESIHRGAIDIAGSTMKTPERSLLAHYTIPLLTEYNVIIVHKGDAFPFEHLSQLSGKRLGAIAGFEFPTLHSVTDLTLERVHNEEDNIRKVAAKRLDGAILSSIRGLHTLERSGLANEVELLPLSIGRVDLGFALSKTFFNTEDVDRFNQAITDLKQSPEWARILDETGTKSLIHDWPLAAMP